MGLLKLKPCRVTNPAQRELHHIASGAIVNGIMYAIGELRPIMPIETDEDSGDRGFTVSTVACPVCCASPLIVRNVREHDDVDVLYAGCFDESCNGNALAKALIEQARANPDVRKRWPDLFTERVIVILHHDRKRWPDTDEKGV